MHEKYLIVKESPCPECGGRGKVQPNGFLHVLMTCPRCEGIGTVREELDLRDALEEMGAPANLTAAMCIWQKFRTQ
jgi:RecJ-like exonuclease